MSDDAAKSNKFSSLTDILAEILRIYVCMYMCVCMHIVVSESNYVVKEILCMKVQYGKQIVINGAIRYYAV